MPLQSLLWQRLIKLVEDLCSKGISDRQPDNPLHFQKVTIESPRNKVTKSSS
ncbi:MAG: hypothetical protein HC781_12620 [Leptolyngbyaceae cyanobacterium CSU_1_4]|nr:hypothetical protein [Leptolyngbyaceae cyanobacterium CSU_1_4]